MAIREELLVKVLSAHLVWQKVIIKELLHRQQIHAEKLAKFKEVEKKC